MAWWELENQPESALAQEVEEAYRRFWDVRARAFFDLDPSILSDVAAGDELDRETKQMDELRAQGRAARIQGQHASRVVYATPSEAVVYDEFLNSSIFVDATTKNEIPTNEPSSTQLNSYLLHKADGAWKVVDVVRHA